MAQWYYLKLDPDKVFDIDSAKIYDGKDVLSLDPKENPFVEDKNIYKVYKKALKYENCWHVSFDKGSSYYLIILDKKTGAIQYNDKHVEDALGKFFVWLIVEGLKESMSPRRWLENIFNPKADHTIQINP